MRVTLLGILLAIVAAPALSQQSAGSNPSLFTLDEQTWVMFYDLPSRRFRTIRDAFVRRNFAAARRDLEVSAGFIAAESERSDAALIAPLSAVAARLRELSMSIDEPSVTTSDFDTAFARAHWLLAQHYLVQAERARDDKRHRTAGHYLWATAHHMERCVLWSNARLTPALVKDIDRLRTMAAALRESDRPERVYRDKPISRAHKSLAEIGAFLNRDVRIAPAAPRN